MFRMAVTAIALLGVMWFSMPRAMARKNALVSELARSNAAAVLETVLYRFGSPKDGYTPDGGLAMDGAGAIYGSTLYGGNCHFRNGGCGGTLFKLVPSGNSYAEQFLYSFPYSKTDGISPNGPPLVEASGDLFGTTSAGGTTGNGTVYEFSPSGSTYVEKVVYNFGGGTNGSMPNSSLVGDSNGVLYGVTQYGGSCNASSSGCGTVFRLVPSGSKYTEQTIYRFHGPPADGFLPIGKLLVDAGGNLYGTTYAGGSGSCALEGENLGCGTVFKLAPSGSAYTESFVYSLTGGAAGFYPGAINGGGVIADSSGALYGSIAFGGKGCVRGSINCGYGVIFKLTSNGSNINETVIHSFSGPHVDGQNPSGLYMDNTTGSIYATAVGGGSHGYGSVFELSPKGSTYAFQSLYSFKNSPDGNGGGDPIIEDKSGALFGTTGAGGFAKCYGDVTFCGTAFKVTH